MFLNAGDGINDIEHVPRGEMSTRTFLFATDTATMCIFDTAAMRHRLQDDADWWSDPEEEMCEVNAGNAAFLNLPGDGTFSIEVKNERIVGGITLLLRCPSGRMFLGAAEEVTNEGLEPEGTRGGGFIQLAPGNYELSAIRGDSQIRIHLAPVEALEIANAFGELLRI